ncbi:hypothetical protein BJX99DRAFT_232236 [Aspergillus californicus]
MNTDSGVQFIGSRRRKRPRRETSSTPQAQPSSSTSRPVLPPLGLPAPRYPGDGLDFRRPAAPSAPPEDEVIDLTNEPEPPEIPRRQAPESSSRRSRGPRFGREIMADVVDLEEQELDAPSSPEVQFVSSNIRQVAPPPPRPQGLMGSNLWRMLPLPQTLLRTNETNHRREVPWSAASHLSRAELETVWIGDDIGAMDFTINVDLQDPFNVEYPTAETTPEGEQARNDYKPLSPAPEGFSRKVEEDDLATCPNCDHELGTGDDLKQQLWVAKQCGHVYCGECAKNRSLTKAKKASAKTKPFAKCQVSECGKAVSAPKSMFQVYL